MLISVIIPCYKQGKYLAATLDSILAQTFAEWECIVVNDGSPDNSLEIAKEYCRKDQRFKYIDKPNGGLSSARNSGIEIARGEYIQFLDSDDLIHPRKFEVQIQDIPENTLLLLSSYRFFFETVGDAFPDKWCTHQIGDLQSDILLHWDKDFSIPIHTALFHRDYFFKHHIRFREDLQAKEDWIFWVACTQINPEYKYNPQVLAYYRKHNESMVADPALMFNSRFNAYLIILDMVSTEILKEKIRERMRLEYFGILNKRNNSRKKYKNLFRVMCAVCLLLIILLIILSL